MHFALENVAPHRRSGAHKHTSVFECSEGNAHRTLCIHSENANHSLSVTRAERPIFLCAD